MNTKTNAIEYSLAVTGIFGRNRSVKKQSFTLIESENPLEIHELIKLRDDKISEINLKSGSAYVLGIPIEYEVMDGVTFKIHKISFGKGVVENSRIEVKS